MKTAEIKQLKARLSEYPRREDDLLGRLAESGELTRAALPKRDWTWSATGLSLPEGAAAKLLEELRADRDR